MDGEVVNNQLSWQWVAGTGARPRRVLNPLVQAGLFDRGGAHVRRRVPELRSVDGKKAANPGASRRKNARFSTARPRSSTSPTGSRASRTPGAAAEETHRAPALRRPNRPHFLIPGEAGPGLDTPLLMIEARSVFRRRRFHRAEAHLVLSGRRTTGAPTSFSTPPRCPTGGKTWTRAPSGPTACAPY